MLPQLSKMLHGGDGGCWLLPLVITHVLCDLRYPLFLLPAHAGPQSVLCVL